MSVLQLVTATISFNLFCIIYVKIIMRRDYLIAFGWIRIKALLTNKSFASISLLKNSIPTNIRPFPPHNMYYISGICVFFILPLWNIFFFNKMKIRLLHYCILFVLHCRHCVCIFTVYYMSVYEVFAWKDFKLLS